MVYLMADSDHRTLARAACATELDPCAPVAPGSPRNVRTFPAHIGCDVEGRTFTTTARTPNLATAPHSAYAAFSSRHLAWTPFSPEMLPISIVSVLNVKITGVDGSSDFRRSSVSCRELRTSRRAEDVESAIIWARIVLWLARDDAWSVLLKNWSSVPCERARLKSSVMVRSSSSRASTTLPCCCVVPEAIVMRRSTRATNSTTLFRAVGELSRDSVGSLGAAFWSWISFSIGSRAGDSAIGLGYIWYRATGAAAAGVGSSMETRGRAVAGGVSGARGGPGSGPRGGGGSSSMGDRRGTGTIDLESKERRVSSEGSAGVVLGVGDDGREFAIGSTDDVRRIALPIRERKDLVGCGVLMACRYPCIRREEEGQGRNLGEMRVGECMGGKRERRTVLALKTAQHLDAALRHTARCTGAIIPQASTLNAEYTWDTCEDYIVFLVVNASDRLNEATGTPWCLLLGHYSEARRVILKFESG
ncbi:hypothetical protein K438DRAFT_1836519 [Mycena galopus ATCC 62051]|nr:hypothetical protein K438DRAFT_1836519 [Mycena galopus ATCC 62051]